MLKRLVKDEAGMTMALAIITMVLVGVMGAGLLVFVNTDLSAVVEVNQGQKALEMADAGVQAAKRQLIIDTDARTHYDGAGGDDLPWSYCYGIAGCTSASPTAAGSAGMNLNLGTDSAKVTILITRYSPATFKVISTGQAGNAKRKIEAIFRGDTAVTFPSTYLTRNNLTLTGSANLNGISFFTLGNASVVGGAVSLVGDDRYFGKWAETTGAGPYPNASGSYPNAFNATARGSTLSGIGAFGTVTGAPSQNTRSFGSNTTPRTVQNYDASGLAASQKIAFPFGVPTDGEDRQQLDVLRKRALSQETPGNPLYIDSAPGNGVDDAGLPNQPSGVQYQISNWPTGSTYDTVRFYEFENYNSNNQVIYRAPYSCGDTTPKGVIVVQNGDYVLDSNKAFNGGVIVRAYNGAGASIPNRGMFTASGNPCLNGYANSGGNMTISGNIAAGSVPDLGNQTTFRGKMQLLSWRELYE